MPVSKKRIKTVKNSKITHIQFTEVEYEVRSVMRDVDDAIQQELIRLSGVGIKPSCAKGCSACCSQIIPVPLPEAHAAVQYIRRKFTHKRLGELKSRVNI